FSGDNINPGNIRETFFVNQLRYRHKIALPAQGDFRVDGKWLFETGGRKKSSRQIQGQTDAYVVADDIDIGFGNKIPLWLFGFLY
ncbi:MAG: AAA family ATPase, partial [Chlorobi bacterium]|nr:AAA family ATPase [Chlorobiota bacterium]